MVVFRDHEGEPISVTEWERLKQDHERNRVALDKDGGAVVSTVWIGTVYREPPGDGPDLIFETLVKGGPLDRTQDRYATETEAHKGHARMLARVIAAKDTQS